MIFLGEDALTDQSSTPTHAPRVTPATILSRRILTDLETLLDPATLQRLQALLAPLHEREERLALILQGANDGIWDWNIHTGEVYYSPRWKSMLGYAEDEIAATLDAWQDLIAPEDHGAVLATVKAQLERRAPFFNLEHRLRHKDGSYRWILARGMLSLDADGAPQRLIGSHTDITDWKEAEAALKDSETNLRSLLEHAHNFAIYRIAVAPDAPFGGKVALVSPSITAIAGITEPDNFATWFDHLHPEDAPRVIAASRRAMERGEPYDEIARFFHPEKQTWVWVHTASTPIFDAAGQLTHFNGLVVDITAQREAEAALQNQMAFENIVTSISTTFINLPPESTDGGIIQALQTIGEFTGVDRSYVFLFNEDGRAMSCCHEWCAPGIAVQQPFLQDLPIETLPWSNAILRRGEVLHVPHLDVLPPEAEAERQEFARQGIRSLVAVPMAYLGHVNGFLGFDTVNTEKIWSEGAIKLLKIVGEIFVNALEHKRAQTIQEGQRQFLELLATGGDLDETLYTLVTMLEEQWPGMLGLILLLDKDGRHLHVGAAASLPETYLESIEGLEIGPQVGSCGTACYFRQRVIVEDIAGDPRWEGLRDLALEAGLRACWSEPVLDADGVVWGTFAMYYRQPRAPTETELRAIEMGAHLVGVALARWRAEDALYEAYQTLEQRVEERTDELRTLLSVQQAITSRLDPDIVLQIVVDEVRRLTGAQRAVVLMLEGDELEIAATSGDQSPESLHHRIAVDGTLTGVCIRTGRPDLIHDTHLLPGWQKGKAPAFRSMISVPLCSGAEPLGVISAAHDQPGVFRGDTVRLLTMLASSATIALQNARLYHAEQARLAETQRRREVAEGLQAILAILNSNRNLDEILDTIMAQASRLLDASAGLIYRLEDARQQAHIEATCGLPETFADFQTIPLYMGSSNRAIGKQQPYAIANFEAHRAKEIPDPTQLPPTAQAWMDALSQHYQAHLNVPLIIRGEVYGGLQFYYPQPRAFSQEDIDLGMTLGNHVALAIENARLYRAEQERRLEAERRRRVAEGLRDILRVLNSDRPLEEILQYIVVQARELLSASATQLRRADTRRNLVTTVAECNLPDEFRVIERTPFYRSEGDQKLLQNLPIVISDLQTTLQHLLDAPDQLDDIQRAGLAAELKYYQSSLTVPVTLDREIGALRFYYAEQQHFSEEDIAIAMALADQISLAIEAAQLYTEARRRADETQTLFNVQQAITGDLDSDAVLQMIAEEALRLTEAQRTVVMLFDDSHEKLVVSYVAGEQQENLVGQWLPINNFLSGQYLLRNEALVINDIDTDSRFTPEKRTRLGQFKCQVSVPLTSQSGPLGLIAVSDRRPGKLGADDARVLTMLASSAVIGLENARLYQQEQERRREAEQRRRVAEGLQDILTFLNTEWKFDKILDYIVYQASKLLGANAGVIYRGDAASNTILIEAASGAPAELVALGALPNALELANRTILQREPFAVSNISAEVTTDLPGGVEGLDPVLIAWKQIIRQHYRAYLAVPLIIKDELYGALTLYYLEPREFPREDIDLGLALGGQVALAIENARLREQAEESAVAAERNRLARDLHDAVTQTLFSATLIAEALPILWERRPDEGRRRLQELRELTRGALAEMRTLLLELRPVALVEAAMGDLLRQLTEAVTGRARLPVTLSVAGGNVPLPPELQVTLYRITQEALNNIVKHANATEVWVTYQADAQGGTLSIRDNGCGFDPSNIPPEHLGIGIMQERAANLDLQLRIHSQINAGAEIAVAWALSRRDANGHTI